MNQSPFPHAQVCETTGNLIVPPGIYPDIPNEDYHRGPGLSSSGIKKLLRSGLHYWDAYLNPDQPVDEPRKPGATLTALEFGTAYHTMIGEPTEFPKQYVVQCNLPDGVTARHKEGQQLLKDFAIKNASKMVISQDDLDTLKHMAVRLRKHPRIGAIYESGVAEQSFFWIDEATGVLCKIRPDWLRQGAFMTDLKTTADASPEEFSRSIFKFGYHISAAYYLDGYKAATKEDLGGNFIFACQEKVRPFALAAYVIEDEALEIGRQQYRKALELYARYSAEYGTDPWPAYPSDIQGISLPGWAFKRAA